MLSELCLRVHSQCRVVIESSANRVVRILTEMENRATAHLSSNQRERNIHFWEEEMSVSEIVLGIEAEGKTTHATVRKWIF